MVFCLFLNAQIEKHVFAVADDQIIYYLRY